MRRERDVTAAMRWNLDMFRMRVRRPMIYITQLPLICSSVVVGGQGQVRRKSSVLGRRAVTDL
jgi:hypothetical protein